VDNSHIFSQTAVIHQNQGPPYMGGAQPKSQNIEKASKVAKRVIPSWGKVIQKPSTVDK
jgi:hypothetical protein